MVNMLALGASDSRFESAVPDHVKRGLGTFDVPTKINTSKLVNF